jgi:hypothetical protein
MTISKRIIVKAVPHNKTTFTFQKSHKRKFNTASLLTPIEYYTGQFSKLKSNKKWSNVICPFHDDKTPSLSLNLETGGFFCHACQTKGGNLISFHMKRYSMNYKEAISVLRGWRHE